MSTKGRITAQQAEYLIRVSRYSQNISIRIQMGEVTPLAALFVMSSIGDVLEAEDVDDARWNAVLEQFSQARNLINVDQGDQDAIAQEVEELRKSMPILKTN